MRADVVTGAIFPDYELTDHAGKHRRLSELQGPDPMILVLSRGGYCPKDLRQAEGLVQLYREMELGYARLVTISTDNVLTTNAPVATCAWMRRPRAPMQQLTHRSMDFGLIS